MEKTKEKLEFLEEKFKHNNSHERQYGESCPIDYDELLSELKMKFPNIEFSESDIRKLNEACRDKENIELDIWEYETSRNHGNDMKKIDTEEYKKNIAKKDNVIKKYEGMKENFIAITNIMNDEQLLNDPTFDIEKELFQPLYEEQFETRSNNPIINKFYETYKENRQKDEKQQNLENENKELKEENTNLKNNNLELKQENDMLSNNVKRLQNMLKGTLEFCESVKRSRFGRFFFGKKIKELPQPEEDIMR